MVQAISVRFWLKTCESSFSLNFCPVVEDGMDEMMDHKEEPSEESRTVRGGQNRMSMPSLKERQEYERTHILFSQLVQTLRPCTSKVPC